MNLTSFLANKCFEYLLKYDSSQEGGGSRIFHQQKPINDPALHFSFPPPWAVEAQRFRSLCDGCAACISLCENKILIPDKNGRPRVDFSRGSCSFCGACAQNCPQGALRYKPENPPWGLRAFITGNCLLNNRVVCSICSEQCDKGAIYLSREINKGPPPDIQAAKCNGCGACFRSCPVGAIAFESNERQEKS